VHFYHNVAGQEGMLDNSVGESVRLIRFATNSAIGPNEPPNDTSALSRLSLGS
jgi:hypothetical protein